MGFFGLYVWHGVFVYCIARKLTGFRWEAATRRTGLMYLALIAAVFGGLLVFPPVVGLVTGTGALLAAAFYSLRTVRRLISDERVPSKWKWILR
jgi:PST family polysaccharide transporter